MKTKRHILATSVAAALALPAVALADVTLYGQIDMSIDSIDGSDRETYISSNSSRLGVKGTEDLGNGLAAIFQLEGAIGWDGGSTTNANSGGANQDRFGPTRDSFVGLQGDFGTLRAGYLPGVNQWVYDANLFDNAVGDPSTMTAFGFDGGRWKNAVQYSTPNLSGLELALTYSFDEESNPAAGDTEGRWIARGTYGNGPLFLGLTHLHKDRKSMSDQTTNALTGSYDFGSVLLVGSFSQDRKPGASTKTRDIWSLGLKAPVGNGSVRAQYTDAGKLSGVDKGGDMWAIGYDHPLSKRTTLYANYADVDNNTGAAYRAASRWGHGESPDVDAGKGNDAFSVGILHKF